MDAVWDDVCRLAKRSNIFFVTTNTVGAPYWGKIRADFRKEKTHLQIDVFPQMCYNEEIVAISRLR